MFYAQLVSLVEYIRQRHGMLLTKLKAAVYSLTFGNLSFHSGATFFNKSAIFFVQQLKELSKIVEASKIF